MSRPKKRNRNIQSLSSLCHINFSKFPPIDNCCPNEEIVTNKDGLFGELVKKECSYKYKIENDDAECIAPPFHQTKWTSNRNGDIDTESINSGVSEIKLITSLSSSPSWSDDNDGSKRVQDELEHMDRVLRGIDPIPLQYDMDEYKQWMETFPNLSLFGQTECGQYKRWKNDLGYDSSQNTARKGEVPFTKSNEIKNLKQYKEQVKKAVICNIYENLSTRLNSDISFPVSACKMQNFYHGGNASKTQTYLSDSLKNSPFTCIIQDRYKKNCFNSRHISLEDEVQVSPRFESLPLMFEDTCKNIEHTSHKFKNDSLNVLSRRKSRRSIILPPIENSRLNSSNHIRSISATPTYSSLLSTKAMKLERKMFNSKSRNIP